MIKISYGEPTSETAARAQRGEVHLGGCVVSASSAAYHCSSCGKDSGTNDWLQSLRVHERTPEEGAALQRKRAAAALAKEERRRVLRRRSRQR